jgi:hypothetical protein
MHVMRKIERFLRLNEMPPTKFGRLAASDPRLVFDVRNGRKMQSAMVHRVESFMARYDPAQFGQAAGEPK